jgi:hypothetical protein
MDPKRRKKKKACAQEQQRGNYMSKMSCIKCIFIGEVKLRNRNRELKGIDQENFKFSRSLMPMIFNSTPVLYVMLSHEYQVGRWNV